MQNKYKRKMPLYTSRVQNKYGNKKITVDGETFDSKKEYNRYCELKLLARAGQIKDLKRQERFVLIPTQRAAATEVYKRGAKKGQFKQGEVIEKECVYIADFVYTENGETVVEDIKGYRDPSSAGYAKFVIKRKLMLYIHGIRIKEV